MSDEVPDYPPCPICGSTTSFHVGHGFDIADYWPETLDWPMPTDAPTTPPDDEGLAEPDDA